MQDLQPEKDEITIITSLTTGNYLIEIVNVPFFPQVLKKLAIAHAQFN